MAEEQAQAVQTPAAAPDKGADTPQIDTDAITLEQLDTLMVTGSAELPVKSGDKGKEAAKPATPKVETPAGEQPPVVETPKGEEVTETRSPEEIETAVTEAVEKVKGDGGDQAAQDAAAEEARKPVAKAEEEPAKPAKPETEPEGDKSRRFRVKDPIAQAALDLYKTFENTDTPITLAEAEQRVKGPPAKTEEPVVTPDYGQVVSTLEAEVAAIETKLEAAGADEGLYNADIAKLNIEHTKKVAALETAKRDLRDANEQAKAEAEDASTTWQQAVAESRARAIEMYPDVADDKTPLGKAVAARISAMRDKAHPDHNLLFTASAPEVITMMDANKLGIQPATKKAAAPAKPTVTPPKTTKVSPASGAKTSVPAGPKPEDAKKTVEYLKSDKASLEELDSVFGLGDPARVLESIGSR